MTPYENLANGIIMYAVNDYRRALRGISYSRYRRIESIIKECEEFFLSDYFKELTKVDGQYLIDKLRREANESNTGTRNTKHNRNYCSNSVYMLR